jgi:hypothetical protein
MENLKKTKQSFDSKLLGIIIGMIIPSISILTFYATTFDKVPISFFISHSLQLRILPQIISLCVLPNLGVFFLFMWRERLLSARGVIFATLFMAICVFVLKLFF